MWRLYNLFRKYRRFVLFTFFVFISVNVFLYAFPASPPFTYSEIYEGTFKGKYLKTIKSAEDLKTDDFYTKWSLIGYLDDLVNEPIQEPTFDNSVDPFTLLDSYETANESFVYQQLPLLDRVNFYANTILPQSNFTFRAIQDIIYKDAYYGKKFINTRLKKWLKIKTHLTEKEQKELGIDDQWFEDVVVQLREKKLEHNQISATEIKHSLTHLKFFSNLFLKPENDEEIFNSANYPEYMEQCSLISKKLFPWLTGETPKFKSYDKKLVAKKHDPYSNMAGKSADGCFIKMLQSQLTGKGIVFTTNDSLVPELAAILAILRITGNPYPIQIFHNNDLSIESIKIINNIANDPIMKLPKNIPEFKVPKNPTTLNITYVDVSNTVSFTFKKYYSHFGMKLLAYMFNTFEEMIMLDTDTVIVEPLEKFFNSPEYLQNHAYFFKDRDANSFLYEGIVDYFKSYLNYDTEMHYLGLPKVSDQTLNNRFFGGMARHFMESGLFVINRKEKFDGVVTSLVLQMFKLFSGSLHGEKEFIWLGQEIMGQSYAFNPRAAIAIGELSPEKGLVSHELCSTHPAHITEDFNLLWFNSGFLTCKKPESYYKDINYERNQHKSLIELKKEYLSPLHITHGLIPPPAEYSVNMKNGEPTRGWAMTSECSNYLWCSYDIIGGGQNPNIPQGKVISFHENDIKKWDYLGRLWVNYFNIGYSGGSDHGYIEGDAYDELGLDDLDVFKMKHDEEDEDVDLSLLNDNGFAGISAADSDIDDELDSATEKGDKTEKFSSYFEKELKNSKPAKANKQPKIVDDEQDADVMSVVDEEQGIAKDFKEDFGGRY